MKFIIIQWIFLLDSCIRRHMILGMASHNHRQNCNLVPKNVESTLNRISVKLFEFHQNITDCTNRLRCSGGGTSCGNEVATHIMEANYTTVETLQQRDVNASMLGRNQYHSYQIYFRITTQNVFKFWSDCCDWHQHPQKPMPQWMFEDHKHQWSDACINY